MQGWGTGSSGLKQVSGWVIGIESVHSKIRFCEWERIYCQALQILLPSKKNVSPESTYSFVTGNLAPFQSYGTTVIYVVQHQPKCLYAVYDCNWRRHTCLLRCPLVSWDTSWVNETWARSSLISFLFFSYLKCKNSMSFPNLWRQDMKDRLGDLYEVIMWAHLLAAIILVCNKNDWSNTLHFLNIQKA